MHNQKRKVAIMKSKYNQTNRTIGILTASVLTLAVWLSEAPAALAATGYVQVNLVSDISSNAPHTDAQLVNPWGIVTGPQAVWVNNNGTGLTKAYGPFGFAFNFAIHVL